MGQKTHPLGFRLGINSGWKAQWFNEKNYQKYVHEDIKIRDYIRTKFEDAAISRIEIQRVSEKTRIIIYTARPGVVFGQKRTVLESLREEIKKLIGHEVNIYVEVIRVPELEANLVAENIARQLEQRVSHRRAMKRAVGQAMKLGAEGIKVQVTGRLGGAEIARQEWYREGKVPLQTIDADIDYGEATAKTIYGTVGVKAWVYKGPSGQQYSEERKP